MLRIPLRGTRLRRAADPGASASPAGLTARARPEARPETRAANLYGWTQRDATTSIRRQLTEISERTADPIDVQLGSLLLLQRK